MPVNNLQLVESKKIGKDGTKKVYRDGRYGYSVIELPTQETRFRLYLLEWADGEESLVHDSGLTSPHYPVERDGIPVWVDQAKLWIESQKASAKDLV